MSISTTVKVVGAVVVVAALAGGYFLRNLIAPKAEQLVDEAVLTANQVAANGPLPGDLSLYAKELACQQQIPTGYYPSLNGAEIADAQRSGIFPCATFTGSLTGPNKVFAWRAADTYDSASYLNNRRPGEIYIVGGDFPPMTGPVPAGPFVAKADATTGRQIWRTYLGNANANPIWVANTNLNILPNGKIVQAWSNYIALLDPDTGLILKQTTLSSGPTPPIDSNFKHVTVAPDGTLIVKNQTKPDGCPLQGTLAIMLCGEKGFKKQGNSMLHAVDPETLQVLASVELPAPAVVPHTITMYEGRIAIYIGSNTGAWRYFWDPASKKLSQDTTWVPSVLEPGQVDTDAPSILGDWIIFQTNGLFSKEKASSIVAVSQKDAKKLTRIFPFGQLGKGEVSWAPPKPTADAENSMIYSADLGMGKVAGIKIDQATGEMKTAFVVDDGTLGFQPLIGPKDKRVLLISDVKKEVPGLSMLEMIATKNYKERVTWRDAATGRILAASDYFEPMGIGNLITPGFGGRVYYMTDKGVIVLQVMPESGAALGK